MDAGASLVIREVDGPFHGEIGYPKQSMGTARSTSVCHSHMSERTWARRPYAHAHNKMMKYYFTFSKQFRLCGAITFILGEVAGLSVYIYLQF